MKVKRYFTVVTSDSGIIDKLAYQMRILYSLGIACEYQYVHTPISFGRSWQSYYLKKFIDKFEKILFFRLGLRIPTYIEKVFSRVERLLNKLDDFLDNFYNKRKYDHLNRFLGLDKFEFYINDSKFSEYTVVDIPLDKILAETHISSLSQLREAMEIFLNKTDGAICCFSAMRMYPYLSEITRILAKSDIDIDNYQYLNFSERYWTGKDKSFLDLPFKSGKIKVVIHIRRGDSMIIDLGSQKIYLHGEVMTSEDFKRLLEVDAGREIEICEYEPLLQNIFNEFGEDKFSCIVISDGYDLTFSRIVRAISRGQLKLNHREVKILRKIGNSPKEQFANFLKYPNVSTIIGESNTNLLKSIHALACADIVIYSSIGFAYGVHKIFRQNQSSVMINVKNHDDSYLKSIDAIIASQINQ
ncbi:hypothetical protein CDG77_02405 [Nostoc sp. 'Peltigera membranacea cyanobiont' 213]|uniref:hypothetical protein n=1 Tax=Nostoc sp. 'Peltigera membranacea cyanobiont' 213 TaxID=2014530 RepID=UPI000B955581|nr:hypothetical protein [Nostoc sp. 'Peltigera membranacea cyanobiont' 213]OYD99135.1 hypothetical protein CDG77_02405 [Nostoc sp. 'Peltigera membranacea cyanobiont' 213]